MSKRKAPTVSAPSKSQAIGNPQARPAAAAAAHPPSRANPRLNQRTSGLMGMVTGTGAEKKFVDTNGTDVAVTAAAVITLLNGVTQGVNANERVGKKVTWRSILLRMLVGPGATPTSFPFRIMLVWDKQTNAAAPTLVQLLASTSIVSPNLMDNRARFAVVLDWVDFIDIAGKSFAPRQVYIRKNFQTIFSGITNTVGSIASGSLYLFVIGGSTAAAGTGPSVVWWSRLRYTDE